MAAVTFYSDFGAPQIKSATGSTVSPSICDKGRWGNRLGGWHSQNWKLIHLITKLFICWVTLIFTWNTHILILCAHSERSVHVLLPRSCHHISNFIFLQVHGYPAKPLAMLVNQGWPVPFKHHEQPGALIEVLSTGRISLHNFFPGLSTVRLVWHMLTFGWFLHIVNWAQVFFFLFQITGHRWFPMRP